MKLTCIPSHKNIGSLFSIACKSLAFFFIVLFCFASGYAQGTWTPVATPAPDYNNGVMLLLTDGSVMVKTSAGGEDNTGVQWDRLIPDSHGSYADGTWAVTVPMIDSRLYFSSQVLKNGNVYVAGGEYGSGGTRGEVYDPKQDTWVQAPQLDDEQDTILDANSEILDNGKVLQAIVLTDGSGYVSAHTYIYNPANNTYAEGPNTIGSNDESTWLKLPDNSILFVDIYSTNAERYIPATNTWVHDAPVPINLYDPYGYEEGASFLLPDGRGFFLGSTNATAYYTPSGTAAPGTWTTGPVIPDSLGAPDAAGAMMVDGNILCAFAHTPTFDSVFYPTTSFYVFNTTNETFTKITAPDGSDSLDGSAYITNMLCLPDGSILYCALGDDQYYIYKPSGAPLAAGRPFISTIIAATANCDTFTATGHLFNGITEGACYGDDWQMNTNYPIVRLTSGENVYYASTYNWNSTGVMRGTKNDTTTFVLPGGLPEGVYDVQVVANGNASNTFSYNFCATPSGVKNVVAANRITVFPNPASNMITVSFVPKSTGRCFIKLVDTYGKTIKEIDVRAAAGRKNTTDLQLDGVAKGVYNIVVNEGDNIYSTKVVVQ